MSSLVINAIMVLVVILLFSQVAILVLVVILLVSQMLVLLSVCCAAPLMDHKYIGCLVPDAEFVQPCHSYT